MKVFKSKMLLTVAAAAVFAATFTSAEASRRRSSAPKSTPMSRYMSSWTKKIIDHQERLQRNVPLKNATFIFTHNSYNSKAYGSAFSYWVDPNHQYSIKDQLKMGVRALELDVHWYFAMHGWPWNWKKKPLLCHAGNNHVGCSSTDRDLNDGLQEIRDFVRSNRDKVIVIYIENKWNGKYGDVLSRIKSKIGDYVYQSGSTSCKKFDVNTITRQKVLSKGKNIILHVTGGCQNGEFAKYVHNFSWINGSGRNDTFKAYPNCQSGQAQSKINDNMMRYWEDGTNLGSWFGGADDDQTRTSVRNMISCGVNMPGMDHLKPDDGRLASHVWSFGTNEPNDWGGNEDCAEMRHDGRWNDNNCSRSRRYACRKGYANFFITGNGRWTGGASACRAKGGTFAAPRDGYENNRLKAIKGGGSIWINFSDRSREGTWQ